MVLALRRYELSAEMPHCTTYFAITIAGVYENRIGTKPPMVEVWRTGTQEHEEPGQ
jgi:hypothetical protein